MKKIITLALVIISLSTQAQDSTKIKGLQLQVRLIEYLTVQLLNPDNDSLYQVYIDLRPKFRIKTPPVGTTLVTIDSIPTVELANLYNYVLSNSEGINMSNIIKSQIAATRTANSYLESLCAGFESLYTDRLISMRLSGRKLLRGRN